jgi:adenine-specific DNA-methyltransferase
VDISTIVHRLRDAARAVREGRWAQGDFAFDDRGKKVDPLDDAAATRDVFGWLKWAGLTGAKYEAAKEAIAAHVGRPADDLDMWHDEDERTAEDVARALEEAAAHLERTAADGSGRSRGRSSEVGAEAYRHPQADLATRPEVGTQPQFRKKKPPRTYRYDSSLSPSLEWDENPGREEGEAVLRRILEAGSLEEARTAADELKRMSRPFLNWAGKAERSSFDVPTLPLFVHERLSTKAILETLKRHRREKQEELFDLFGDPHHSITDQVLRAYEHRDRWVNRLILGDSLVVMNSLLHYEGLGGQVQMIYIDPPYGVKFGSNFQPFVRRRDVKHNDDLYLTRELEVVQAYRDTWELGVHSYLSYLRDRFYMSRELLSKSGSIFVQSGSDNVHLVRNILDELFGASNHVAEIVFVKTTGKGSRLLDTINDHLLWYARDIELLKYRQLYVGRSSQTLESAYTWIELEDGTYRKLTRAELLGSVDLPQGRRFNTGSMVSQSGGDSARFGVELEGSTFSPSKGTFWKTNAAGMENLKRAGRLLGVGHTLVYKRYADDFPVVAITNWWGDTKESTFAADKTYVVQTHAKVVERCLLMVTDPGDLVLDPTCGSGTTAYVAEQWGRRWITIDTSRVPLALTRQRLLTATFPWYELQDEKLGPAGGFVYRRRQNRKGEEVGGIVPHVTLKSIANDEPPAEEVLVDRPEVTSGITRVTGPFCVEATIPTPVDLDGDGLEDSGAGAEEYGSFVERMLELLRKSPVVRLEGNRSVTFTRVRPPARSLSIQGEALVEGSETERPVALVFGPENGAVSEKLVFEAAREANARNYSHLFVFGFAIQPNARELIEKSADVAGVPATYVQATPDLVMGDLLKTMRSSQLFSVCGLPDVEVRRCKPEAKGEPPKYEVTLVGLDVFDPVTMEVDHRRGDDVPAWFLDTDYNGLCFRVCQAFFPRTGAWDNLSKALRASHEESVFEHLAGTTSAPFEAGEQRKIAVKVIDDRGNELLVVKDLPAS